MKIIFFLFALAIICNFAGCFGCPYSFSGASVPPHLKSIAIPFAEDKSGLGEPNIRELLTQKLTQKFIDDNNLKITDKSTADALLECSITSLSDAPAVVAAGENVAKRRVSISVQVIYKDLVKKKIIYEKQFSYFGDYFTANLIEGRKKGIEDAIEKITNDILLDTVSGW